MERRTFLGGLTAASFGVMLENSFTDPARATTEASLAHQTSFETSTAAAEYLLLQTITFLTQSAQWQRNWLR
jgi:hypothetical protein